MADLTIEDVPDELLIHLRRSAKENRRSLNSEILHRLERSVGSKPVGPQEFLTRVRSRRERLQLPPLTDEILEEGRADGRP